MAKHHSPRFLKITDAAREHVQELTVDDVKGKLDRNEKFVLVDVREDNEWTKGHLPRAIHIGRGVLERDIEDQVSDIGAEIVLYCGGGFRSALAAESLERMGYKNVYSMDGGYRGWIEKSYGLEGQP